MDVQSAPPVYTPVGTPRPPSGNPPVLGQQVPGMTGGLPAQSGLSVLANPMAQQLQSYGRGNDSMLVHMTPREVNSLQGLAATHGGSLTINPSTGLPEAGFLSDILPTLLGIGASFIPGVGPLAAAALIGGGTGLITGDLNKGLMAGLGAFGGASLGGALGAGSVFGGGAAAGNIANLGVSEGMKAAAVTPLTSAATAAPALSQIPVGAINAATGAIGAAAPAAAAAAPAVAAAAPAIAPAIAPAAAAPAGFFQKFGAEAARGLGGGAGKASALRTGLAATGVAMPFLNASQQMGGMPKEEEDKYPYGGPYRYERGEVSYPTALSSQSPRDSSEHMYFPSPQLLDASGNPVSGGSMGGISPGLQRILSGGQGAPRFAKGGEVSMARGSFVADARTVSELGNGSSSAGQELLARMGGQPLRGPGDGVSDSIPARIGRDQPARVARDEVLFSPEAVRRIGKGSEKRGAQKLYALMDKAHKARKKAKRGQDTGLRKGLA